MHHGGEEGAGYGTEAPLPRTASLLLPDYGKFILARTCQHIIGTCETFQNILKLICGGLEECGPCVLSSTLVSERVFCKHPLIVPYVEQSEMSINLVSK